jgi:hypothetical protein
MDELKTNIVSAISLGQPIDAFLFRKFSILEAFDETTVIIHALCAPLGNDHKELEFCFVFNWKITPKKEVLVSPLPLLLLPPRPNSVFTSSRLSFPSHPLFFPSLFTCQISMKSIDHKLCPLRDNVSRGLIHSGGYSVEPREDEVNSSLVHVMFIQVDPKLASAVEQKVSAAYPAHLFNFLPLQRT